MKTKRPATIPTLTTEQMKGLLTILADAFDHQGVKTIKRTRKRQIERAKFMDHTGYEWSQWWHKATRKAKRWK